MRQALYVHLVENVPETETQAGSILGTPSYMAPEIASGLTAEVDQRSDVYLLGGTLYEILTGQRPRSAKTALEMVKLAQSEPPTPAAKVNADVPKALDAICSKAMAHCQEDRYQTALELADDIQRYVAGESVSAYPERFLARVWRWAKRHARSWSGRRRRCCSWASRSSASPGSVRSSGTASRRKAWPIA